MVDIAQTRLVSCLFRHHGLGWGIQPKHTKTASLSNDNKRNELNLVLHAPSTGGRFAWRCFMKVKLPGANAMLHKLEHDRETGSEN